MDSDLDLDFGQNQHNYRGCIHFEANLQSIWIHIPVYENTESYTCVCCVKMPRSKWKRICYILIPLDVSTSTFNIKNIVHMFCSKEDIYVYNVHSMFVTLYELKSEE